MHSMGDIPTMSTHLSWFCINKSLYDTRDKNYISKCFHRRLSASSVLPPTGMDVVGGVVRDYDDDMSVKRHNQEESEGKQA